MEKEMKKHVYDTPVTEMFVIQLEGSFMQSSIQTEVMPEDDNAFVVEDYEGFDNELTFD